MVAIEFLFRLLTNSIIVKCYYKLTECFDMHCSLFSNHVEVMRNRFILLLSYDLKFKILAFFFKFQERLMTDHLNSSLLRQRTCSGIGRDNYGQCYQR